MRVINRIQISRSLAAGALALAVILALTGPVASQQSAAPTFTKDVAPILQEKCQACHRPGYIAPMSLLTYDDTRPWAKSIRERVLSRQMPPWHIDKSVGIQHFANDRSLSDDQVNTIVRWIDGGASASSCAKPVRAAIGSRSRRCKQCIARYRE